MNRDKAILETLLAAGPFAFGSHDRAPDIAEEWNAHNFDAPQVREWLEAGCFDASAAAKLRDLGVTPDKAARQDARGVSYGYAVANRDMGAQDAADALGGPGGCAHFPGDGLCIGCTPDSN